MEDHKGFVTESDLKIVEFKDHRRILVRPKNIPSQEEREAPLPHPHYVRIHAAGKFFDELLAKFGNQDGSSAVRCWEQFDRVVETHRLRKSLLYTDFVTASKLTWFNTAFSICSVYLYNKFSTFGIPSLIRMHPIDAHCNQCERISVKSSYVGDLSDC
jgi:hypothetical protein